MMTIGIPKRVSTSRITLLGGYPDEMPRLPKGVHLRLGLHPGFLTFQGVGGTRYFLGERIERGEKVWMLVPMLRATRADVERTLGGLKRGQIYADTINPVYFGNRWR